MSVAPTGLVASQVLSIALSASARARTAVDTASRWNLWSSRIELNQDNPSRRCARPNQIGCSEDASCNASVIWPFSRLQANAARRLSISVSARATSRW
ncbi:Uncharacterised protein [Mycobacterium tuberculosis]|uniref:Uncharacterized protein n=1 Tax=Mycobacterium tuberculosis TaxID=1773 RepID=A0A654TMR8_MYCTX|nr:Uncharacterised protein [Mycobacterium tuberculosis]COX22872.1 Uncharacterised protein [Mycobacterium tuberculosis]SGO85833.1 Uncharacterised protein [Mycobacterium tuberculosis]